MKSTYMKSFLKIALIAFIAGSSTANAKDLLLWGKQKAGWGPGANAEVKGNSVTLIQNGEIIHVEGNAYGKKGFCLWKNRRAVLCGGTDRAHSLVGAVLSPGTYSVLPKADTWVRLKIRVGGSGHYSLNKKKIKLWGEQTAGWGPGANAEVKGNSVTLVRKAEITHVQGNAYGKKGFCLWKNRRAVLCGGTDREHSLVGAVLSPGTYTILPKAGTRVDLTLQYINN